MQWAVYLRPGSLGPRHHGKGGFLQCRNPVCLIQALDKQLSIDAAEVIIQLVLIQNTAVTTIVILICLSLPFLFAQSGGRGISSNEWVAAALPPSETLLLKH